VWPDLVRDALGALSGSAVGFSLGLVGGGGSILAVPLMVFVVGVPNIHTALGTTAFVVAANAVVNLVSYARMGTVKWRCAAVFAATGMIGAFAGSSLSKTVDGERLLVLFAALMLTIAAFVFVRRTGPENDGVELGRDNVGKLVVTGALTGALSGFFCIGGGFLIVPALMFTTGMPFLNAVGSSLMVASGFGATAALNFALSGLVDWRLAAAFIVGGILGGALGCRLAKVLSGRRGLLNTLLACVIVAVAFYILGRSVTGVS
jgi:uncharacterized membrane protein YfcA